MGIKNILETFYEIEELEQNSFAKLRETLTRIGLRSRDDLGRNVLNQTAHILHKKGRYYIVHFKQMFQLDGKQDRTHYTIQDKVRIDKIVNMLHNWNLIKIKEYPVNQPVEYDEYTQGRVQLTIIPYKDKSLWVLKSKYDIGNIINTPEYLKKQLKDKQNDRY